MALETTSATSASAIPPTATPKVSLRVQCAVYAAGTFSNSMSNLTAVILPLWLLQLDPSPLLLGIVIGSRHFLPLIFSIHGGALMDRLGTRRVMVGCAAISTAVPLLFPISPWIPLVIVLQMLNGLGVTMGWIGAQASIGQLLHGNPVYAGRFSFSLRIGTFAGPPMIGLMWDWFGPWGGFGFMALWGAGILVSGLMLPAPDDPSADEMRKVTLRDLVPRWSDYVDSFKLLAIPSMALLIVVTMLRIAGNGIQESFYIVYLQLIGLSGTEIGLLMTAASILGGAGSLAVGWACRYVSQFWLLIITVMGTIFFIAITPLLSSFLLLAVASALRGGAMGMSQPLMITILADSAGSRSQGKGVALRTTANRAGSSLMPIMMGATAQMVGLENSFLVVGAVLMAGMVWVALYVKRSPAFKA